MIYEQFCPLIFDRSRSPWLVTVPLSNVYGVTVAYSAANPSLIIDSYLGDWSGRPSRPKQRVGSERPWHKESHDMPDSVRDGLWRPEGAFFQIGLGCVMSHHQSPHRRALHIPVLILAGKFKMEFLPTVSH